MDIKNTLLNIRRRIPTKILILIVCLVVGVLFLLTYTPDITGNITGPSRTLGTLFLEVLFFVLFIAILNGVLFFRKGAEIGRWEKTFYLGLGVVVVLVIGYFVFSKITLPSFPTLDGIISPVKDNAKALPPYILAPLMAGFAYFFSDKKKYKNLTYAIWVGVGTAVAITLWIFPDVLRMVTDPIIGDWSLKEFAGADNYKLCVLAGGILFLLLLSGYAYEAIILGVILLILW